MSTKEHVSLEKLLARESWVEMERLIAKAPELAAHRFFGNHWTLLHYLVYTPNVPLSLIECVARAYPKAIRTQNQVSETPLHLACDRVKPRTHIVQACVRILQSSPEKLHDALMLRDSFGRTPFHLLCANNADIDTLELVLKSNPYVLRKFDPFVEHPLESLGARVSFCATSKFAGLWAKVRLLVLTAMKFQRKVPVSPEYLLHGLLRIPVSNLSVILIFLDQVATPHQVLQRDYAFNLPLHVLLTQRWTHKYHYELWRAVDRLLTLAPKTALVKSETGKYPLQLALRSNLPYPVIRRILRAAPALLEVALPDLRYARLDTVWELVRTHPSLLQRPTTVDCSHTMFDCTQPQEAYV